MRRAASCGLALVKYAGWWVSQWYRHVLTEPSLCTNDTIPLTDPETRARSGVADAEEPVRADEELEIRPHLIETQVAQGGIGLEAVEVNAAFRLEGDDGIKPRLDSFP